MEWTVPLGAPNLPRHATPSSMDEMADATVLPPPARLGSLLDPLNGLPEALVVLNHPLDDERRFGPALAGHTAANRTPISS